MVSLVSSGAFQWWFPWFPCFPEVFEKPGQAGLLVGDLITRIDESSLRGEPHEAWDGEDGTVFFFFFGGDVYIYI